ncbi:MAG: acyltransferase [Duncaniella sp.]|nr:acyltransferase [Duncaniella sp.]
MNTTVKKRLSNMEALRIIAMSMILIHHFLIHGITPENIPHNLYYVFNGLVYGGVSVFFMLSGYFSIRFSITGLVRLILTIVFFEVVNVIMCLSVGETPSLKEYMVILFFPISKSPYWFIKVYLFLYVTAPILNAGLRNMSQRNLRNTLILLVFFVFYGFNYYASTSYLHGAYLYCIGYYLNRYKPFPRLGPGVLLTVFIVIRGLSGFGDWLVNGAGFETDYFHTYRNVMIFVSGVALILFFARLNFTSKTVNTLAKATLGCYLLQDGFFGYDWLYQFQERFLLEHGFGLPLLMMFSGCFIAFWALSLILTRFSDMWLPQLSATLGDLGKRLVRKTGLE